MQAQSLQNRSISRTSATAAAWPVQSGQPASVTTVDNSIELMGATMSFVRNAEIYGENEPAEYLYKVMSGAVRTYKVLSDGRRQVAGFYLPGDFFGLETGSMHAFSAEAVCDSRVMAIKRGPLTALAGRNVEIARQLWDLTAQELERAQAHMMLLMKTAQERVSGFLLDMAARSPNADEIDLPMSRQDIADFLGLTIETVSRTLTQLESKSNIAVPSSRHIVLRNRAALKRLNA